MLRRERDPELDAFSGGCLALSRDGAVVRHVATVVSPFWSPGRLLTDEQRVRLVVTLDDSWPACSTTTPPAS